MTYLRRRRKSVDVIEVTEIPKTEKNCNDSSVFAEELATTPGNMAGLCNNSRKIDLCGTLPFCDNSAETLCKNITINRCEQCSLVKASFFVFFLVLLGLTIFIGNMLIITVGYLRYRKKKMEKLDILKVSLAFADLLTGTFIFEIDLKIIEIIFDYFYLDKLNFK